MTRLLNRNFSSWDPEDVNDFQRDGEPDSADDSGIDLSTSLSRMSFSESPIPGTSTILNGSQRGTWDILVGGTRN